MKYVHGVRAKISLKLVLTSKITKQYKGRLITYFDDEVAAEMQRKTSLDMTFFS